MSLLPLLFSNWWEGLEQPHRIFDQNFGIAVSPDSLNRKLLAIHNFVPRGSVTRCPRPMYDRTWNELMRKGEDSGSSTVKADKDKFHVDLDVQQFAPEEINVKIVDRFVVVEGKHEEKQDEHGWISRQFSRKYMIPEQCDIDQVSSKLSSDGILSIIVPRKQKPDNESERTITIEHTGKPVLREGQSEEKKSEES